LLLQKLLLMLLWRNICPLFWRIIKKILCTQWTRCSSFKCYSRWYR